MALIVVVHGLLSAGECTSAAARIDQAMAGQLAEYVSGTGTGTVCRLGTAPRDSGAWAADPAGGYGRMVALSDRDLPWAPRTWAALLECARIMGIAVGGADPGEDVVGLQDRVLGIRYTPGAWLPEHSDTTDGFRARQVGKVSATVRLAGPQTVSWGWLDPPDLEIGD
ncbi:MAG: hypothetical protein OXQ28_11340, partial [Acidobacteriota bacterium]|nr:hypothetical protein [Acidobacteriota bacterium]